MGSTCLPTCPLPPWATLQEANRINLCTHEYDIPLSNMSACDMNYADAKSPSTTTTAQVVYSLYMVIVTIVLLNLLIALINESYSNIRENAEYEALR